MRRKRALAYISAHNVLTLATSGPDGVWAAALFYVNDEFDLYFLSAAHTRHARHLAQNPRVAATIQEDYAGWREIKGVQLEGNVHRLQPMERQAAIALYRQKFAFLREPGPEMEAALAAVAWYRLRPDLLFFVDNSRGFGHRDKVLPASPA